MARRSPNELDSVAMRLALLLVLVVVGEGRLSLRSSDAERRRVVEAVLSLARGHFTGSTVAFFYDLSFGEVVVEDVLRELHSNWTVLLPTKALSSFRLYDDDGGIHSYIHCSFVIPIKNERYAAQVSTLLYSTWNMDYTDLGGTHTRFIIFVDGQINETEALEMLMTMFQKGDVDVVFIGMEEELITVYTIFPFGPDGKSCPEDGVRLTKLAQWVGPPYSDVDIFPKKIPITFSGCKFPVSTLEVPPIFFTTKHNTFDGIDYRMMMHVAKLLNTTLNITHYNPLKLSELDHEKGMYKGYLLDMRQGKVWAAIGGSRNSIFNYRIYFVGHTYINAGLFWFLPNVRPIEQWKMIILAYEKVLWICTIVVIALYPVFITIIEKIYNFGDFSTSFGKSIFAYWSLALGNSTGFAPSSNIIRIAFASWLFFTIHLNNAYIASLTGLITGGKMEPKAKTFDDIIDKNLPTALSKNIDEYLSGTSDSKANIALSRKIISTNYTDTFIKMSTFRNMCFLATDVPTDYRIKENGYDIYKTPVMLFSTPTGVLMNRNHFMFNHVDIIISRLISGGINNKIIGDFTRVQSSNEQPTWTPLTLQSLSGPFLILLVGLGISVLVFVFEILSAKKIKNKSNAIFPYVN